MSDLIQDTNNVQQSENENSQRRVAVLFIHGQGEQNPLQDVEELARTVWRGNPQIVARDPNNPDNEIPSLWTVPNSRSSGDSLDDDGLADSGRVTTSASEGITEVDENGKSGAPIRVDFLEFYWAHLMHGTRLGHLFGWFLKLQERPRSQLPERLLALRQWIMRSVESFILLAMVFCLSSAGLLLYQRSEVAGTDNLPVVDTLGWWFSGIATLVVTLCILSMFFNEVWFSMSARKKRSIAAGREGGASSDEQPEEKALMKAFRSRLIGRSNRGLFFFRVLLAFVSLALIVLGVSFTFFAPGLSQVEVSIYLSTLTIMTACLFFFRKIKIALVFAALATLFAFLASMIMPGDTSDLSFAISHKCWVGSSGSDVCPLNAVYLFEVAKVIVASLALFAVFWVVLGFEETIAAAKYGLSRAVYFVGVLLISVIVAFVVRSQTDENALVPNIHFVIMGTFLFFVSVGMIAFLFLKDEFLLPVLGDSARYFGQGPENIAARNRIRKAGVKMLRQLHASNKYDRVVIVAHSLGSVVGYEILSDYWTETVQSVRFDDRSPLSQHVDGVEQAIQNLAVDKEPKHYRKKQRLLCAALNAHLGSGDHADSIEQIGSTSWLISDFITLGSPLTYAPLLMAKDPDDWRASMSARKVATCPPTGGVSGSAKGEWIKFKYKDGNGQTSYRFNHAAVFSTVRWSNLYFAKGEAAFAADIIGGPVRTCKLVGESDCVGFGYGIDDISFFHEETGKMFAHNEYWRSPLNVTELRMALQPRMRPLNQSNRVRKSKSNVQHHDRKSPHYLASLIDQLKLLEPLPRI